MRSSDGEALGWRRSRANDSEHVITGFWSTILEHFFFWTCSLKEPLQNKSLYFFLPGYFKVQLMCPMAGVRGMGRVEDLGRVVRRWAFRDSGLTAFVFGACKGVVL